MFKEKMKELKAQIFNIGAEIVAKTDELKSVLNSDDLEKAREIRAEIDNLKSQKEEVENNLKTYEIAVEGAGMEATIEKHEVKTDGKTYRDSVNEWVRTKGAVADSNLKLEGKDLLIPMNAAVNPTQD